MASVRLNLTQKTKNDPNDLLRDLKMAADHQMPLANNVTLKTSQEFCNWLRHSPFA